MNKKWGAMTLSTVSTVIDIDRIVHGLGCVCIYRINRKNIKHKVLKKIAKKVTKKLQKKIEKITKKLIN